MSFFSWAVTPPWKVCCTVSLILSSFSRRVVVSTRTFSHVCSLVSASIYCFLLFFLWLFIQPVLNFVPHSCKAGWQINSWAGKCCFLSGLHKSSLGALIDSFSYIPYLVCSQTRTPSRAAGRFSGTQEKCATCSKTVYPIEKVNISLSTLALSINLKL